MSFWNTVLTKTASENKEYYPAGRGTLDKRVAVDKRVVNHMRSVVNEHRTLA